MSKVYCDAATGTRYDIIYCGDDEDGYEIYSIWQSNAGMHLDTGMDLLYKNETAAEQEFDRLAAEFGWIDQTDWDTLEEIAEERLIAHNS